MHKCTGEETTQQLVHHLRVPVDVLSELSELAAHAAQRVHVWKASVTSFFMPRQAGAGQMSYPRVR
nr:hypothetical protein GCM10017611_78980 [Rhodococcus wratislaviensis]